MRKVAVQIEGVSPLSWSRHHTTEKLKEELHDAYEKRTWRNKVHSNGNGCVVVPAFALRNTVQEAAKYLSKKIPGGGAKTWTKHFNSGLLVQDAMQLEAKVEDLNSLPLFVPSDGRQGGGKRVLKYFPLIEEWDGTAEYFILDDKITEEVFEEHLRTAGQFIGLGALRVGNRGVFGRFDVKDLNWAS